MNYPEPIEEQPLESKKADIVQFRIIDTAFTSLANLNQAHNLLRGDFEIATQGAVSHSWIDGKRFDYATMVWQRYGPYSNGTYAWGPNFDWVKNLLQGFVIPENALNVELVIHNKNWKIDEDNNGRVWGYNLGMFFGDRQVQVVRSREEQGASVLLKTISMELAHAFDNFADKVNINLEQLFDVVSWDEDVIHGRDPRYPVYDYRPVYAKLKPILITLFPFMANLVDEAKLTQLYQEILFRAFDPGASAYIGNEEDFVRRELLQSRERANLKALVSAARSV